MSGMSGAVKVDVELHQVLREGYLPVDITPIQAELLARFAKQFGRPLHDERIFMYHWTEAENPMTNLKVWVHNTNKRLAVAHLMLRRSYDFGYFLTYAPNPIAALVQATAEAIKVAARA